MILALLTLGFFASLAIAAYLGFALVQLPHDKLVHFITFYILTLEFYFLFDTGNKSLKILRFLTVGWWICSSIFLEIAQSIINPKRVFDVNDILANVLGGGAAFGTALVIQAQLVKRARAGRYRHLNESIDGEEFVNVELPEIP